VALRTHGRTASFAVVTTFCFGALAVVSTALLQRLVDLSRLSGAAHAMPAFGTLVLAGLAVVGFALLRRQALGTLASHVGRSLSSATVDRLVGLSVEYLDSQRQRELENRLHAARHLQDGVVRSHLTSLTDLVAVAMFLCFVAYVSAPLAGVLALTVAASALASLYLAPRLLRLPAANLARSRSSSYDLQPDLVVGL
jgi:ABC-type bacteriocin/lantibiotic exporter with double-glycine peptidase domain